MAGGGRFVHVKTLEAQCIQQAQVTLADMVRTLRRELDLDEQAPAFAVIGESCRELGIATEAGEGRTVTAGVRNYRAEVSESVGDAQ